MTKLRRAVLTGLLVLALAAAHPASSADGLIQPGDKITSSVGGCTLSFVYDGHYHNSGKVYLGTAAHCVSGPGEVVVNEEGEQIGHAALVGDPDVTNEDYALIEIFPHLVPRVSAAVKGHPSYPTGVTTPSETYALDLLQISGYGTGFWRTRFTQESRVAALSYDDRNRYSASGPLVFGDSGGPLVHIDSGKALGIVSRVCFGACTVVGPTVESIIAKSWARGYPISLRTV